MEREDDETSMLLHLYQIDSINLHLGNIFVGNEYVDSVEKH